MLEPKGRMKTLVKSLVKTLVRVVSAPKITMGILRQLS